MYMYHNFSDFEGNHSIITLMFLTDFNQLFIN